MKSIKNMALTAVKIMCAFVVISFVAGAGCAGCVALVIPG
jgi:hypothetical protein